MAAAVKGIGGFVSTPSKSLWASKYRGATVQDLDRPPALSLNPTHEVSQALDAADLNDFTYLTVISENRALLGYLEIPTIRETVDNIKDDEEQRKFLKKKVKQVMKKFHGKGKAYKVISMETSLEELEEFFNGGVDGKEPQDFAIVTDYSRRFVLGVATKADLKEFADKRAA